MSVFNSLLNLINTNNGQFKSIKQSCFMSSEAVGGIISISGGSFDKTWIDMFSIDSTGIIAWDRQNYVQGQTSNLIEKWNREGTAVEQVKESKRIDKYNNKLAKHNSMVSDAETYYNELCLDSFGYVPCKDKRDLMHTLLQKSQDSGFVFDFIMANVNNSAAIDEFAISWSDSKAKAALLLEQFSKESFTLLEIRCKVKEKFVSDFQFDFM